MKLFLLFLSAFYLLAPPSLSAKIRMDKTVATLQPLYDEAEAQIKRFGAEQVLVVLDLDNTTLHNKQLLGSYAWFKWQEKMIRDSTVPQEGKVTDNLDELFYINGLLFSHGSMEIASPGLSQFLHDMKRRNVPVLCLSARSPIYWADTIRDIQKNGLSFKDPRWDIEAWKRARPIFTAEELTARYGFTAEKIKRSKFIQPVDILLREGVFFASGQHKGAILEIILKETKQTPKAIIFADDSKGNVVNMKESYQDDQTELSTFRYSFYDREVEGFAEQKGKRASELWKVWQSTGNFIDQ